MLAMMFAGGGLTLAALLQPLPALAREDPKQTMRMAVTDASSALQAQPRIWMVNFDGNLRSKNEAEVINGWVSWGIAANSGLAGVSLSGTTQRERVFFRSGTSLLMRGYDGAGMISAVLPAPSGATVTGDDVGAVTWNDAGIDRIAVAARRSTGGTCVWEGTFTTGFTSAPSCISSTDAPADIAAASVGTPATPAFFYAASGNIVRVRRTGANTWSRAALAGPPGGIATNGSLDVLASTIMASTFELAVNATPARLGRVSLTAATINWGSAPALPSGLTVATDRNALSLVRYRPAGAASDRMALGVTAYASGRVALLRLNTNTAGSAWNTTWTSSGSAPVSAYPRDEQSFFGAAAGAALVSGTGTEPMFFGPAGANALIVYGATVQGFGDVLGWRDYIRPQPSGPTRVLGYGELDPGSPSKGWVSVAETVANAETISGWATGIRRNNGVPWEVTLSSTTQAGALWDDEFVVAPLPSLVPGLDIPESLTDPYLAREPGFGGSAHHLSIQVPLDSTCNLPDENALRLVYRTGTPSAIADMSSPTSPGLSVIATGALDHGGLAVTEDAGGLVTAHIAYNDDSVHVVRYVHQTPTDWTDPVTPQVDPSTPQGYLWNYRAGISRGVGERVYAWGFSQYSGLFKICPVYPTAGTCVTVPTGSTPTLMPDVLFGAGGPPGFGTGNSTYGACYYGGLYYRCFEVLQPAITFSRTIVDKVYVAYQGNDSMSGYPSIFYTTNVGGMSGLDGPWTTPLRVHDRPVGSTVSYIDPSIVVDADETVAIAYSEIQSLAPLGTPATSRVVYKLAADTSFTVTSVTRYWYPEDLGYHCRRNKYFVGEYLEGDSIGGRSFLTVHADPDYFRTELHGFWASRWSIQ
jgi:hypothetical protein